MGGGLSLRLAPPLSACSPSGVMTKKPLEPASAEAYPTSTSSAASLSLNALSSGFPSGSRPAPSATSETIAGLPSSAPPPRSLSAHRNLSRSSSSLSGDSLVKTCTSSYRSLSDRLRANDPSCSVAIVRTSPVRHSQKLGAHERKVGALRSPVNGPLPFLRRLFLELTSLGLMVVVMVAPPSDSVSSLLEPAALR